MASVRIPNAGFAGLPDEPASVGRSADEGPHVADAVARVVAAAGDAAGGVLAVDDQNITAVGRGWKNSGSVFVILSTIYIRRL